MTEPDQIPAQMDVEKTSRPLRVALVYSRLPFPMMRGDQLTVSHLLSFLSARGHYTDFISLNLDGSMTQNQYNWLNSVCDQVNLFDQSLVSQLFGLLRSLALGQPLQVGLFFNRKLNRYVTKQLELGSYDVVYVYYLRSAPAIACLFKPEHTLLKGSRKTAAFLAMQLSQTLNTRRIVDNTPNGIKKMVYLFEWRLLRRYEARVWQRFTRTFLIGDADVKAISTACKDEMQPIISNWEYGAHGTDVSRFRAAKSHEITENRVVFAGSMHYQPNYQAILWFVENCWGLIRSKIDTATLCIVGRDPAADIQALHGKQGIFVTGTVDDVGTYIRSASVCINPVRAAGGMQNKLIEYLASATPVVATSVANEGIRAPNGVALLVQDDPIDFSNSVLRLLTDRELASGLAAQGRQFILDKWTWESHFLKLESNFYSTLDNSIPQDPANA